MPETLSAVAIFRAIGLMADGPLPWGRPVPARGPGVFVVELPLPLPSPPIELTRVGKWVERVPDLRLDGAAPTSKALAARLASFWLPSQVILYIGATEVSIGGRLAAMERTVLGDRRPHSGGHWLKTLDNLASTRLWWASTAAVEEYEDALLTAFAEAVPEDEAAGLPDPTFILPFGNLRRPTGERRASGITGSLLALPTEAVAPPTHVVTVPDGDADGATDGPAAGRSSRISKPATGPRPVARATPRTTAAADPPNRVTRAPAARRGPAAAVTLTADGASRLTAELDELTRSRRPEVIARIKAAKELGDLKENADYTAAREEQSFLEGRIQALQARLRDAVIAEKRAAGAHADIGSAVTVEVDGLTATYTLVGSAESDPAGGRLSVASPVGKALVGAMPGDEVAVRTPRGDAIYRVVRIA